MRKKIFLFVGAFGLFVSTGANSQQISREVLQRFNPSVVTRVYSVASKLSMSDADQLTLAKTYGRRDSLVASALKRNAGLSEMKEILNDTLICHYDSLIEIVDFGEKNNSHLQKTFETLDAIKPLTDDQKTGITRLFLPKCDIGGCVYADILREVLPRVLTDTAYYAALFKSEIERKSREATSEYPAKSGLSERAINVAGNLIYSYQKALLLANYALPYNDTERRQMVYNIGLYYRPLIDSILVRHVLMTPKSQFTVALNIKSLLKLTDDQVSRLVEKNAELQKLRREYSLKNNGGEYNSTDYHRKNLREILTEDQVNKVLQLCYQSQAQLECDKTWGELKKKQLVTDADSVKISRELYFYYIEKKVIPELYYDKPDLKAEKLYKNNFFKPEILKRLEALWNEEKAKAALRKGKNDSFVW
ncbi:MAG TPA: hypothetical protein VK152_11110 [Paludibacter sp.]|nr:hypothetical protein [Paludibacter sp.]